jgi:formate dehydrogenase subunit gamma
MSEPRTVERFRKRTIWLHWIHTLAFLILVVTGAILLVPGLGGVAAGGTTRIIHRICIIFFVGIPILYALFNPRTAWHFIKETLSWGKTDLGWLKAAPGYYFLNREEKMPPQGHVNGGQKMWQFVVLLSGVVFLISGALMLFFRNMISPEVFQWSVIAHDIAFILVFLMLLVHIYTGSLHPMMTESFKSMLIGKISPHYARSHYGKWFDKISAKSE